MVEPMVIDDKASDVISYMETEEVPETVKITTSDGETFELNRDIIDNSETIRSAAIYDKEKGFPLPNVDAETMRNVIRFFELYYYQFPRDEDESEEEETNADEATNSEKPAKPPATVSAPKPPEPEERRKPHRRDAATVFCYELDQDQFKKLIANASYLQSEILLDYCLMAMLMHADGLDVHALRDMFMLPDNYSVAEEERVMRAHMVDKEPSGYERPSLH
uniref:Skp1_POZ domain-containing protein n=1 Tax=Panagrellus redivivus TaxID=6233 RepID=A0A7E4UP39_PANRE